MSGPRRLGPMIALAAVLAVALGLRLWGVNYGLPAVYNPDEVSIMNRALALWPNGLNPGNFLYPSLYFYALFAWEGGWFALGRAAGIFASLAEFERTYFVDPTSIFIAGRALTALLGTATVWVTWRLGTRLYGGVAGWVAAGLLAVAPLAVRDAHYVKHDVPAAFLIALTHLALASTLASQAARSTWIGIGVIAGLAISTHYYAVFVLVPVVAMALGSGPTDATDRPSTRLLRVAASAAVAFAVTSPFLLLEPTTAWRDMVGNRQIVMDRVTGSTGLFGSLGYYLTALWRDGIGPIGAALSLGGFVVAATSGWPRALVMLAFPVAFVLFISNTFPASRYLNAVLPLAAVAAGAAVSWLAAGRLARLAGLAVTSVAIVTAATASVRGDRFFLTDDTRTLAQRWIDSHLRPGASILVQPYSVPLRQSRESLVEALTHHLGDPSRASIRFQRLVALDPYPAPAYRTLYLGSGGLDVDKIYLDPTEFDRAGTLAPARTAGVTHVVMKRYNDGDPAMAAISRALEREGRLLATFSPYRADASPRDRQSTAPFLHNTDVPIAAALERPGPIIEIWSTAR